MPAPALPSLSAIVPNYNHGKFLDKSIPAILHQSVPPAEIIVLDDASTDNSVEVIQRLAAQYPLIRLVRNEKNLGVMPNLNKGLELARSDYIYIGSADDEVQPGLFEKSLPLLAKHPQAAFSCSACRWHDTVSGLSWIMAAGMADRPAYLSPEELVALGQRGKLFFGSATAIWRRQALQEAGNFIPALRWHADWFATYVPGLRHGVCYLPEALSDFYLFPTSFYNRGRKTPEHLEVLRGILDRLSSPDCADVAARFRDSAVLAVFGLPILRLLKERPAYAQFRTPLLTRRATRRSAELLAKRLLPKPVAKLALRIFYPASPLPAPPAH